MRQIVKKSIEYDKLAFIYFIGLTKAFDKVDLSDVINKPRDKEITYSIIEVI